MPLEFSISNKAGLLFLNIYSANLFFDVLITGLLDLLIYGPDSRRSGLKHYIQNYKDIGSNPTLLSGS